MPGTRPYGAGHYAAVLLTVLFLLAATSVPYYAAYALGPEGKVFCGTLRGHDNVTNYYSFIKQYEKGSLLADNRMTPEAHEGVYFNLEWYLVGLAARLTGDGFGVVFQTWRVASVVTMLISFYLLTGLFGGLPWFRVFSLFVFGTAGGFGWAFVLMDKLGLYRPSVGWWRSNPYPVDITPGFFPFTQMMFWPHFCFSMTLVFMAVYFYVRGRASGRNAYYLAAGMLGAALWLCRPYDALALNIAVTAYAVIEIYRGRVRLREFIYMALSVALSVPAVAYNYLSIFRSPAFKEMAEKAVVMPPLPLNVAVGLGLVLPLFVYCLKRALSGDTMGPHVRFMMLLAGSTLVLLYSFPIFVFSNQFGVLLAGFVMLFCYSVAAPLAGAHGAFRGKTAAVIAALVLLNALSSAYIEYIYTKKAAAGDYSLDRGAVDRYLWLKANSSEEDVVMGEMNDSQFLYRYSGNRLFIGHHSQTIDVDGKTAELVKFFDGRTPDSFRTDLLKRYGISYVLYGPAEKGLGDYNPFGSGLLSPVFQSGEYAVFKVASF